MKITLRGYYAILALANLARREGTGGPTRIEDIAAIHPIPETFLLQVFQALKRSGLVQSKRGAHGGYTLSRPAEQITLTDIVESVEGGILPSPLEERTDLSHYPPSWTALDRVWDDLRAKIREVGDSYTLADLASRIHRPEMEMYYI